MSRIDSSGDKRSIAGETTRVKVLALARSAALHSREMSACLLQRNLNTGRDLNRCNQLYLPRRASQKDFVVPVSEIVFMFSGQGSQYFHMGRSLYEDNRTFRGWMIRLDEIARQSLGKSVVETLYSDVHRKGDPFDRMLLTHPAIFMVEYSLAQALIHAGVRPDMVLGVSLGAFAAATVAGFIEVDDAFAAVMQQAIAVEQLCEPGGMTAVLGAPSLFSEDFLASRSELAAVNFSSHFVVSARRPELDAVEAALQELIDAWSKLPDAVRAAVLVMVRAARPG